MDASTNTAIGLSYTDDCNTLLMARLQEWQRHSDTRGRFPSPSAAFVRQRKCEAGCKCGYLLSANRHDASADDTLFKYSNTATNGAYAYTQQQPTDSVLERDTVMED